MFLDFKTEEIAIIFYIIIPGILSYILVPLIKILAHKFLILDKPNSRKIHTQPIPNVGGISIFISFFISIFFLKHFADIDFENLNTYLFSSLLVFLIGLIDDLYNLSPLIRLISQFSITTFIWSKGINISNLNFDYLNFGENVLKIPSIFSILLTFFWVSGIINAINWIDGLNGLATGITILILIGIAKIAFFKNLIGLFSISLVLIGASLGFLFHNLKSNNIIMGDNGSNFLGFQLSILSLYAGSNYKDIFYSSELIIFPLIPIFLMGFPIADMIRVILKRVFRKSSPFLADRNHFHHLLLDTNFSSKEVLILIFSLTFYLISFSFLFTGIIHKIEIFTISNFILLIEFVIFRRKFKKKYKI